jgi:penicillin-binding protein 1A
MSDWMFRRGGKNRYLSWLDIDSWIDSSLYSSWNELKSRWNALSDWFAAKFRLSGKAKVVVTLASEGLTLGAGGLLFLLVLAIPAFREIDEGDWLARGKYSVTFLDRYGNEIGKRGERHDDAVPLEEIPEHMIQATLATEDRRFYEHFGVDIIGTARALVENTRYGETVQGGSTLTQQLAKNLFLTSERSIQRKIKEAFLAMWLEARLTKQEILKLYLDRAYMGGGAFGVEAAAQFYFGKSVRNVTLAEAAMLSGMYKAPSRYAPHVNLPNARARADDVLTNLVDAGFMTEAQVHGARTNPASPVEMRQTDTPEYFLDWAFEEVQRLMQGRGEYVLTVKSTVDLSLQRAAEEAVNGVLRAEGRAKRAKNAALVAMEPDGAVRALVGGQDYGESQFNRATTAKRQPGSSFKSYVFLTALENGYTPRTTVRDAARSCGPKGWSPKNYSGGYGGGGSMPLSTALAKSLNTVAVELSLKVGREKVLETIEKLGINGIRKTCSMALGDTGISVLEHTQGYAHFASGGKQVRGYAVLEIQNSKGEIVYSRESDEPEPVQLFDEKHIAWMNSMLHEVVEAGTGKRAHLDFAPVAGKTGTSSAYRDAWFVGFTGKYVTGVWFGNDDYRPMNNVTGGSLPAEAWASFMKVAHTSADIPPVPGLPYDPERARRAMEMAKAEPEATPAEQRSAVPVPAAPPPRATVMPKESRESLSRLASLLKQASDGQELSVTPPAVQPTAAQPAPAAAGPPVATPAKPGAIPTPAPASEPRNRTQPPARGRRPANSEPSPASPQPARPPRQRPSQRQADIDQVGPPAQGASSRTRAQ